MPKYNGFSKQISENQRFIYTHTLPVRISDVNYGNHLAAAAVPFMLHQVRLKFLTAQGFSEMDIEGVGLVVADLYVSYQCESFFDDALQFQMGVENLGHHSAILVYTIENLTQKKTMGCAKERIVFFDPHLKKIAPTPQRFSRIIQALEKSNAVTVSA